MSDAEISKILPIKPKKPKKLVSQNSFKKRQKELEKKLKEKAKLKREEMEKAKSQSPVKRVHNNYKNILKDRFNLGKIKKVEMVDAWTQTSNTENENTTAGKVQHAHNLFIAQNALDKPADTGLENMPSLISRESTQTNVEDSKGNESPTSLYKKTDPDSKFRVRVNSTISNNKTFRSPISNAMNSEYKKREYNASFSLNKKKILSKNSDLYQSNSIMRNKFDDSIDRKSNNDFGYDSKVYSSDIKRNKSSRHSSFRNEGNGYPQTQIRRSPDKYKQQILTEAKAHSVARGKFSTHYSNKDRRKSNQYLPDLKPNHKMMTKTKVVNSGGFSNSSMMESNNSHLRSMSKDYNFPSFY